MDDVRSVVPIASQVCVASNARRVSGWRIIDYWIQHLIWCADRASTQQYLEENRKIKHFPHRIFYLFIWEEYKKKEKNEE